MVGAREGVNQRDVVGKDGGESGKETGKREEGNGEKEEFRKWTLHVFLSSPTKNFQVGNSKGALPGPNSMNFRKTSNPIH